MGRCRVDGWMGREGVRQRPHLSHPATVNRTPGESDKCEGVRLGLNLEWGTLFKACVSTTQPGQCLLRSFLQDKLYDTRFS